MFGLIILGAAFTLLVIFTSGLFNLEHAGTGDILTLLLLALFTALLIWIWFGTYYYVKETQLYMRFGPFRGKMDITDIHTLLCDTTMWSGFRPALARNGIIIKYNSYDQVYISPDSNTEFVRMLSELNPNINVIRKPRLKTRKRC